MAESKGVVLSDKLQNMKFMKRHRSASASQDEPSGSALAVSEPVQGFCVIRDNRSQVCLGKDKFVAGRRSFKKMNPAIEVIGKIGNVFELRVALHEDFHIRIQSARSVRFRRR